MIQIYALIDRLVSLACRPPAERRPAPARPSADATRERILDAALDLFADRSFEGATTREIAARAGVSQPSLNYHFRTKDELWQAAVDRLFAELDAALLGRVDGLRGVDDRHDGQARHPRLHRLLRRPPPAPPDHHPGEQGRGRAHRLAGRRARPAALRADHGDVRAPRRAGRRARHPAAYLYYILTGAGPTIFVLAPECRRLAGFDPLGADAVETHADAVIGLLFGR